MAQGQSAAFFIHRACVAERPPLTEQLLLIHLIRDMTDTPGAAPMTIEPSITSRPYSGVSDLLLMQQFLAACTAARSPYRYWPIGELLWSMHYSPDPDPCQNARLWEDANGQIVGFVWFDNGEIVLQVHPRFRGSGLLEEPMLAWAVQRAGQST